MGDSGNTNEKNFKTPQRLRFTDHDILYLLREVVQNNPFRNPVGWEKIKENLQIMTGKTFLIKTLKNRIERLLEQFIKDDEKDQKRSGIEEPQTEKDILLCEIAVLASEYKGKTAKKVSKEQQIAEIGKQVRARYAENLKIPNVTNANVTENQILEPQNDEIEDVVVVNDHSYVDFINIPLEINSEINEVKIPFEDKKHEQDNFGHPSTSRNAEKKTTPLAEKTNIQSTSQVNNNGESTNNLERRILFPSRKRQRRDPAVKKSSLSYLTDKQEKDREIKLKEVKIQEKQLELEERRLCLEEKKFEWEIKEREQRSIIEREKIKLELEEKRISARLLEAQQMIIDNFCKSLNQNIQ